MITVLGRRQQVREPESELTVRSHMNSHKISHETARTDLQHLEDRGLLVKTKRARSFVWHPAREIAEKFRGASSVS
jgi:Fic family protein